MSSDETPVAQCCSPHKDIKEEGKRRMCLLVGGEHWRPTSGLHPKGIHASLSFIGRAYANMRQVYPREDIIVIAQLKDCLEWLTNAGRTGMPLFSKTNSETESAANWTRTLESTMRACKELIEDGGADFDYEDVNPATILSVLSGEKVEQSMWAFKDEISFIADLKQQSEDAKAQGMAVAAAAADEEEKDEDKNDSYREGELEICEAEHARRTSSEWVSLRDQYRPDYQTRMIPKQGVSSCVFAIYSHGWFHSTSPNNCPEEHKQKLAREARLVCDVCKQPHVDGVGPEHVPTHPHASIHSQEWFVHLPYSTPKQLRSSLYQSMTFENHHRFFNLLYWQQLFKAYHSSCSRSPERKLVVLYQYCSAGGGIKFMDLDSYKHYYNVHKWPLYIMSSSGATRSTVAGGLFDLWFSAVKEGMISHSSSHSSSSSSPFSLLTQDATLGEVFEAVENRYWQMNKPLQVPLDVVDSNDDCIMCRQFHGAHEHLGLCTKCFAAFEALPTDLRPDLDALRMQTVEKQNRIRRARRESGVGDKSELVDGFLMHRFGEGMDKVPLRAIFPTKKER